MFCAGNRFQIGDDGVRVLRSHVVNVHGWTENFAFRPGSLLEDAFDLLFRKAAEPPANAGARSAQSGILWTGSIQTEAPCK